MNQMDKTQRKMLEKKLNRYGCLLKISNNYAEIVAALVEEAQSTKAIVMNGMPRGSNIPSDLSTYVSRKDSVVQKLVKKREETLSEMIRIGTMIERLEDLEEQDLMTKLFIYGYDMIELIERKKSLRTLQRIYNRALENLYQDMTDKERADLENSDAFIKNNVNTEDRAC